MSADITHTQAWWGVKSGLTGQFHACKDLDDARRMLTTGPHGSVVVRRTVVHIDETFDEGADSHADQS